MAIVSWLATVIYYTLLAFIFMMWARLIVDFVRAIRPSWRPRSILLVVLNLVYAVTDPPVKLVRRWVRPVRFGGVGLDFSWTIVLLVAIVAMYASLAFV